MKKNKNTLTEDTLMKEAAEYIKARRTNLGLSQELLAEKVFGSSNMKGYISKVESGEIGITVKTFGHFREALRMRIVYDEY